MKTTIDIADSILLRAKKLASSRNTTLKAIVEAALLEMMARVDQAPSITRLTIHTFEGKGLQKGLSWDDWNQIRDMGYKGRGG